MLFALYRKVKMSTPILIDKTLKFCARVQCVPAEPLTNGAFCFFCFFSLEIWDPKPQISPKNTKTQISGKKKKRKAPIRKRLGRGTLNTYAKFQSPSLKNGVDIGLWRKLGFCAWVLEPACRYIRSIYSWSLKSRDSCSNEPRLHGTAWYPSLHYLSVHNILQ